MFKRLLVLMVPVGALVAVAIGSPASADTFYKCPHGVTNHDYCKKIIKCVVPQVRGDTVSEATVQLAKHDCERGKVTKVSGHGVARGEVVRSNPAAGTTHLDKTGHLNRHGQVVCPGGYSSAHAYDPSQPLLLCWFDVKLQVSRGGNRR